MNKQRRVYGGWKYADRKRKQQDLLGRAPEPLPIVPPPQLTELAVATALADLSQKDEAVLAAQPSDADMQAMLAAEAPDPVLAAPAPVQVEEPVAAEEEESSSSAAPVVKAEPRVTLRRKD